MVSSMEAVALGMEKMEGVFMNKNGTTTIAAVPFKAQSNESVAIIYGRSLN